MSALLENVVAFKVPPKPRVKMHESPPDQRKFAVIPIRACTDRQLTEGMMRAFILICSYMNRSGVTWVSQKKLAKDLQISQQAISRHLVKLVKAGYLEVLRKPSPGERSTTWRVIFDPSIKAEDAIAITSTMEDTRPPYMKKEQAKEAEQPDPEGQRRVAQMIAKAFNKPTERAPTMTKPGQSLTVKKMKEDIAKAGKKRIKREAQAQPLEVVPQEALHTQPKEALSTTSEGCTKHKNKVIYKDYVLHNNKRKELIKEGLTDQQIDDNLGHLLDAYAAEGLTPDPDRLPAEVLQLARRVL